VGGVTLTADLPGPLTVHADRDRLAQILINLVDNAVKYTPSGGSVTISLEQAREGVALIVEDTGIGIDPADARRIFEPFVRLDEGRSRDTGGSGLGLAIARSIAVAHGGTLEVGSRLGGGSRFTISLPAA